MSAERYLTATLGALAHPVNRVAALGSYSERFVVCVYDLYRDLRGEIHPRHAPQALQPTSKPGRPQYLHH
jgi:hypothetical protein